MTPRVLLVGCGLIAQAKHLPALRSLRRQASLEAVCDANAAQARQVAKRFGVPRAYTSLTEALRETNPDLAILCTPPQTHRSLSVEILRAGKHLFLEKPMALNSSECLEILTASEQAGGKVCVAFSQSFTPVVCRAYDLVLSGKIGPLVGMNLFLSTPADYMTTRSDHWVHRLPGGALSETGPHVVHMAMRFLGPVQSSSIKTRKHQDLPWLFADDYRIQLECEKGLCSITLLYTANDWAARVDLLGERGHLILDLESGLLIRASRKNLAPMSVWRSGLSEGVQILGELGRQGLSYVLRRRKSGHQILLKRFLASLRNGAEPPVSPQEGLEVTRVLEQLLDQLKTTGRSEGS